MPFTAQTTGLSSLCSAVTTAWESSRSSLPAEISWVQSLMQIFRVVFDHLPSVFVFGGLAALVMLYATLFGVGAVAYRTLFANRETQR